MLRDQIKSAMKESMKNGEKEKLTVIRMMLSAIKDKDVDIRATGGEITEAQDADILKLLETLVKQRRQSIKMYEEAGRQDLVDQEQREIEVIQAFLPKQLSVAEQETAIKACIEKTGAKGIQDMGAVMACLREQYAGQMDFGKAAGAIKSQLAG